MTPRKTRQIPKCGSGWQKRENNQRDGIMGQNLPDSNNGFEDGESGHEARNAGDL